MTCRVVSTFFRLMILGPPGSGKGTIGKRLADTFHLKHVSSGDALRDHITRSTSIGMQVKELIEDGQSITSIDLHRYYTIIWYNIYDTKRPGSLYNSTLEAYMHLINISY